MPTIDVNLSLYNIDGPQVSIEMTENPAYQANFVLNHVITESPENNARAIQGEEMEVEQDNLNALVRKNVFSQKVAASITTFGDTPTAFYYVYVTPENESTQFTTEDLICRADNGIIVIGSDEVDIMKFLENHTTYEQRESTQIWQAHNVIVSQNSCITVGGMNNSDIAGNPRYRYCNILYSLSDENSNGWIIQNIALNPDQDKKFKVGMKAYYYTDNEGNDLYLPANSSLNEVYIFCSYNALQAIS
jgi:hypothetical protein